MSEVHSRPKPADDAKRRARKPRPDRPGEEKPRPRTSGEEEALAAKAAPEVNGEAAPPPEAVEPDPALTPEEAEQARRKYLLTRFWISARGYWGRRGDKLAWPFTVGLLILICINV